MDLQLAAKGRDRGRKPATVIGLSEATLRMQCRKEGPRNARAFLSGVSRAVLFL